MLAMFDDFFSRAIIAGVGFALIAGPFGCFVLWQRLAYFGDSLAHSALLGIALALAFDINILIGIFAVCLIVALIVARVDTQSMLSGDSMLGVLSHATLSIGLVLISLMYWIRVDVLHFLFGDILAVSWGDILLIYAGGIVILLLLFRKWNSLICLTVNEQIAAAEDIKPANSRLLMMIMLAAVVAMAMKIVGIILTVSLLIIPAAAARQLAKTPEQMAVLAAVFGVAAVLLGLLLSIELDTPPGPSIVANTVVIFLVAFVTTAIIRSRARISNQI